jgi:hypothetical protein
VRGHPVADRPHGVMLRSARDRIDGRGFSTANDRLISREGIPATQFVT